MRETSVTLKSLGPMKISFDYEISIDDKKFKDSYQEWIHGVKKEDVDDEYLKNILKERMNKLYARIVEENQLCPSVPDEVVQLQIKCEVTNYTHGFIEADIKVDFPKR
jgi:hypothetical protein